MNRRKFLKFLGLGAVARPLAAAEILKGAEKVSGSPMTMTEAVAQVREQERFLGMEFDYGQEPSYEVWALQEGAHWVALQDSRPMKRGTMTIDKGLCELWQRKALKAYGIIPS